MLGCGVIMYDLMAPKWNHQRLSTANIQRKFGDLNPEGLLGGYRYQDAVLDDARLVLRVIKEAVADGAMINYARVEKLLRDSSGSVCGVALRDTSQLDGQTREVKAKVVVNASGPWTDSVRAGLNVPERLRKLRGSHLIFDKRRFPLPEALTLFTRLTVARCSHCLGKEPVW